MAVNFGQTRTSQVIFCFFIFILSLDGSSSQLIDDMMQLDDHNTANLVSSNCYTFFGKSFCASDTKSIRQNEKSHSGLLPTEVYKLTKLTLLDVSVNKFAGPIPSEFGLISTLTSLSLSTNQLTNTLPTQLFSLADLNKLNLDTNMIFGTLPTEVGNLRSLTEISLNDNNLNGPIPSEIVRIGVKLKDLLLYNNFLTGTIPSFIGRLSSLEDLEVNRNKLSGSFASDLKKLDKLKVLKLSGNEFSGGIEFGNWAELTELRMEQAGFSGVLPDVVGSTQLLKLKTLAMNSNNFIGTIPTSWGRMTALTNLMLNVNQLSGTIPTQLGLLTNLRKLYLRDNLLEGTIPTEFSRLKNLVEFYVYGTKSLCAEASHELFSRATLLHDLQVCVPTASPTRSPTRRPTPSPTRSPTTAHPTTSSPTRFPSKRPTKQPTESPTPYPSKNPTEYPHVGPSFSPTAYPTLAPVENQGLNDKFPGQGGTGFDFGELKQYLVFIAYFGFFFLLFTCLLVYVKCCSKPDVVSLEKEFRAKETYPNSDSFSSQTSVESKASSTSSSSKSSNTLLGENGKAVGSLLSVMFVLGDLISDVFFCIYLFSSLDERKRKLGMACLVFICLPILCNTLLVMAFSHQITKIRRCRQWIEQNDILTTFIQCISIFSVETFALAGSGLFYCNMPLSRHEIHKLRAFGMVNNVLEDIPQLVIVILANSGEKHWPPFAIISLVSSLASLIWTMLFRFQSFSMFYAVAFEVFADSTQSQRRSESKFEDFDSGFKPSSSGGQFAKTKKHKLKNKTSSSSESQSIESVDPNRVALQEIHNVRSMQRSSNQTGSNSRLSDEFVEVNDSKQSKNESNNRNSNVDIVIVNASNAIHTDKVRYCFSGAEPLAPNESIIETKTSDNEVMMATTTNEVGNEKINKRETNILKIEEKKNFIETVDMF